MTRKIKYSSNALFKYDPNGIMHEQVNSYMHFDKVTFHLNKSTKLPSIGDPLDLAKLKKWIENSIEIEFHCVSNDVLKASYYLVINAIEDYSSMMEQNTELSQKDIVSKWETIRNKYRFLTKKYDNNSRLFFESSIQIYLDNGIHNLFVSRIDFDATENDFLRSYLIYNLDIRKEFLSEVTTKINDELHNARDQNNEYRPLIKKAVDVPPRVILEYAEMLHDMGYIKDHGDRDNLSAVLVKILNCDKRKFDQKKSEYKKGKYNFKVLNSIFQKLHKP